MIADRVASGTAGASFRRRAGRARRSGCMWFRLRRAARELADAVDRVVIVDREQKPVTRAERICLADQPQRPVAFGVKIASSSARAPRARVLQRVARRVRGDLHPERHRRAAARRRGYPFAPGDRFLLTFDNHNSVNGIREFARARGAETTYVPSVAPDLRVDERVLAALPRRDAGGEHHNLFAYPGAVELLRRPASARVDRAGARARLGRARSTPPRSCRRTGSTWRVASRTSSRCRSTRCSASRPASARCSRGATRSRSSSGPGSPAARSSPRSCSATGTSPLAGAAQLRGRHRQLPQPPGGRDRAAPSRARSASTRSTRASRRSARGCSTQLARAAPRRRQPGRDDLRPAIVGRGAAPRSPSTSCIPTAGRSTSASSTAIAARAHVSLRTGCFCNPGAGEVAFTISRETLLGGDSARA